MSAADIARLISSAEISAGEIRRAAVHLSKPLRTALFSENSPEHRTASGKFFEALVYEILLTEGETSDEVFRIAAKLNDAEYAPFDRFSKDGLWYSRTGEIQFRVDGRAAAEVDFLVSCSDNTLVFGEVTLHADTAALAKEAADKKILLKKFLDAAGIERQVQFVFVTTKETDTSWLEEGDACSIIEDGENLWRRIHVNEVLHKKRSPAASSKRADGKELFKE
ncbi:MAG TPA: hypothetical protein O0X97_02280 [Methanocorpusculum sp.]|nr:hypothetical protein [Methanocorpusculum sp.]